MDRRTLWLTVIGISALVVGLGVIGGLPRVSASVGGPAGVPAQRLWQEGALSAQAQVSETITYQGRLTDPQGDPLDGTYGMQFTLYDAATAGSAIWDSGPLNVEVTEGLFTVDLTVSQASFDGQALWLQISVGAQVLSPRQELRAAPYALGLRPGARISGEPTEWTGWVFRSDLEGAFPVASAIQGTAATGYAVYGNSDGGYGLRGYSAGGNALSVSSDAKTAGVFSSNEGYGIRVTTQGTDHWDHAGYFTSDMGYGLYGVSSGNDGVRGEGDIAGVRGRGDVIGTYGFSTANFGLYGGTSSGFGVYGYTASATDNYGMYTPDNLYAANYHMTGALMQVAQNGGEELLEAGDVVAFAGIEVIQGQDPVVTVAQTGQLNDGAVAGVVYGRYDLAAARKLAASAEAGAAPKVGPEALALDGPVAPGDYLLIVVHGLAQTKAEAVETGIKPGDLLATGARGGYATTAAEVVINGVKTTAPGTVFAKALEPVERGRDLIYVYVTLQ